MSLRYVPGLLLLAGLFVVASQAQDHPWIVEKHEGYRFLYTSRDQGNLKEYNVMVERGIASMTTFFDSPYQQKFDIVVHPNRHSLDSTWQKDWGMSEFRSECWMVASGVALKLDMISPKRWGQEACEHRYEEVDNTQRLITHELVHVYHGQRNASPDFSGVEGLDWFVEGLATYASGQCDSVRMTAVKKAIRSNNTPATLDAFWKGDLKYGLSGSVVMYLDQHYGRVELKKLLPLTKKAELLAALKTTELELLEGWKKFMSN